MDRGAGGDVQAQPKDGGSIWSRGSRGPSGRHVASQRCSWPTGTPGPSSPQIPARSSPWLRAGGGAGACVSESDAYGGRVRTGRIGQTPRLTDGWREGEETLTQPVMANGQGWCIRLCGSRGLSGHVTVWSGRRREGRVVRSTRTEGRGGDETRREAHLATDRHADSTRL